MEYMQATRVVGIINIFFYYFIKGLFKKLYLYNKYNGC